MSVKEKEPEYLSLDEAARYTGIKRATIYNYLHDLGIKTYKVGRDRRAYIRRVDVARLKEYKETPWKVKVAVRHKEPDDKPASF